MTDPLAPVSTRVQHCTLPVGCRSVSWTMGALSVCVFLYGLQVECWGNLRLITTCRSNSTQPWSYSDSDSDRVFLLAVRYLCACLRLAKVTELFDLWALLASVSASFSSMSMLRSYSVVLKYNFAFLARDSLDPAACCLLSFSASAMSTLHSSVVCHWFHPWHEQNLLAACLLFV